MNKRDKAIMDWVKNNRPNLVGHFRDIIDDESVLLQTAIIGFEAGRKFQIDNPNGRLGRHKMLP